MVEQTLCQTFEPAPLIDFKFKLLNHLQQQLIKTARGPAEAPPCNSCKV
jgi:hypothetical protein